MKEIVNRYRISKFKRFMSGILFATIATIALLCIGDVSNSTTSRGEIILPFTIAFISILMGFVTMFHQSSIPKRKITMEK
ncbi:MAG TPA: hypothetical protein VJZ06_05695 [Mobilitalea sp.]|nr:hypothetical protein [Mobilitalea sp.]